MVSSFSYLLNPLFSGSIYACRGGPSYICVQFPIIMPIKALPQDTIRLLGSPLVVTSPVSLVKELIENSIDARATSIEVLISPNTVDKIEVRDNGAGIFPDDFDSLGRRGHTSKLGSFEELRNIGGSSYGFRGEALASANALGAVTITTRTSQDSVASTLHLVPGDGGVAKQQSASGPVGTTVTVTALFARLPVREQLAMKERQRTIAKIKDLLPSFAFARPSLRISFKVVKNDRMGWSYAPRPQARVKEAVLQIFGSGLASQCSFETHSIPTEGSKSEGCDDTGVLTLQAFLPRPDADRSTLSKGAYISVDSRPVNSSRGTMRKLSSAYKTHLSAALGISADAKPLKDPFIQLNILCPRGWYDPNVEPSKDDIIFSDESKVLEAFESLCVKVYGEEQPAEDNRDQSAAVHIQDDSRTLAPHTPWASPNVQHPEVSGASEEPQVGQSRQKKDYVQRLDTASNDVPQVDPAAEKLRGYPTSPRFGSCNLRNLQGDSYTLDNATKPKTVSGEFDYSTIDPASRRTQANTDFRQVSRGWKVDMSAGFDTSSDEDDEQLAERFRNPGTTQFDGVVEDSANPKEALNPWTIAKMAVPNDTRQPAFQNKAFLADHEHGTLATIPIEEHDANMEPPILRHPAAPPGDLEVPLNLRQQLSTQGIVPGGPYRSPITNAHVQTSTPQSRRAVASNVLQTPPPSLGEMRLYNSRTGNSRGSINLPFSLGEYPMPNDRSMEGLPELRNAENAKSSAQILKGGKFKSFASYSARNRRPIPARQPTDVEDQRKEDTNLSHMREHVPSDFDLRRHLRPATPFNVGISETFSHGGSATNPSTMTTIGGTGLPAGVSRSYLMKRQRSLSRSDLPSRKTLRRTKSELLPLERTPVEQETCKVIFTMTVHEKEFNVTRGEEIPTDSYQSLECPGWDFDRTGSHDFIAKLEVRIKNLWSKWTERLLGTRADLEVNLLRSLKELYHA